MPTSAIKSTGKLIDLVGERKVLESRLINLENEKQKLLIKEGEIRTELNHLDIRMHRLIESQGTSNA